MNDFTKIKLINELIDVVARFYELKASHELKDAAHLKGFCEGMAYTLIAQEYLTQDEANNILKGLGKKRDYEEPIEDETSVFQAQNNPHDKKDDLDIPTFIRKQK